MVQPEMLPVVSMVMASILHRKVVFGLLLADVNDSTLQECEENKNSTTYQTGT